MCLLSEPHHVGDHRGHDGMSIPLCWSVRKGLTPSLTFLLPPARCVVGSHFHLGLVRVGEMGVPDAKGPKMARSSHLRDPRPTRSTRYRLRTPICDAVVQPMSRRGACFTYPLSCMVGCHTSAQGQSQERRDDYYPRRNRNGQNCAHAVHFERRPWFFRRPQTQT
jgi:hypothetical protein